MPSVTYELPYTSKQRVVVPFPKGKANHIYPKVCVPSALAPLKLTQLELFLTLAHATLLKIDHGEIASEVQSLELVMARHLSAGPELYLHPKRVGSKHLPLVEFLRSAFNGKLGNGLACAALRQEGYLYFSHFEDLTQGPSSVVPRIAGARTPDFIAINAQGTLCALEAKASSDQNKRGQTFHSHFVLKNLATQVDPWVGRYVQPAPGLPAVVISRGVAVGTQLELIGSAPSSLYWAEVGASSKVPAGVSVTVSSALTHFAAWVRLIEYAFWPLPASVQTANWYSVSLAGREFLFMTGQPGYFYPFFPWYGYRFLGQERPILLGIERHILSALLAELRRLTDAQQQDFSLPLLESELHRAVVDYSRQGYAEVRSSLDNIDAETQGRVQWAAFPEGIIAVDSLERFQSGQRLGPEDV